MSATERGVGRGLRVLRRLAASERLDRLRLRRPTERAVYSASRNGFRAVSGAGRTFERVRRAGGPARALPVEQDGVFDLTPTDEQKMIAETFREFAERRLRPAASEADAACAAPPELLAQLGELGVGMLAVPEELGGAVSERSSVSCVLAAEALAWGDMGLTLAALATASVATALALWGDGEQQATYLPWLLGDGRASAAIALAEPSALLDPLAPRTGARRDGEDYVLSGVKALVPRAGENSLLIVGAHLHGEGPGLFLLETGAAGVLGRPAPTMGVRAAATGQVLLHDVRVPVGALLAEGDPAVYRECLRRARLAWCALALGTARAVLDYVIPYVNERVAFGEPISHRQGVAFAVADMAIELEGMRLATLRAASRADAGEDFAHEVALARALCVAHGPRIGSDGVQLLGGHGYVTEHPVERWYRDLQAVGVFEGAVLV